MVKQITTQQFIEKAEIVHGKEVYDYSLVQYENAKIKIKIICHKHGIFEQMPTNHLKKHGCNKCGLDKSVEKNSKTKINFIIEANKIHNFKYDYSLVAYKNNTTKVNVTCLKHGKFQKAPKHHLRGQGCPLCSSELLSTAFSKSLASFIKDAKKIHKNKYDYTLTEYINSKEKITIICPKHDQFEQLPANHLRGSGCPKCSLHRKSKGQMQLFFFLKERYETILTEKRIQTVDKLYIVDIFFHRNNAVIEYYGDYWHCNPKKYKPDYFHKQKKMYAMDMWKHDRLRKKELEDLGYKVFIVWESDFKNNPEKEIRNLTKEINKLCFKF
jgi:G:T-mismatch repair DNA endonuclease (very short patch repair protein)